MADLEPAETFPLASVHQDSITNPFIGLSALSSNTAGFETFRRYRWQAKQTVILWLACLGSQSSQIAVVCEHLEDVVLVTNSNLRFIQLKSRAKGSWSARSVCQPKKGIDSLVRSYLEVEANELEGISTFELFLEGPQASEKETTTFFGSPSSAGTDLRKKIIDLGLPKEKIDDFLSRVVIHPNQPSLRTIDATVLHYIGALWPNLTFPARAELYQKLLGIVEGAQAKELDLSMTVSKLGKRFKSTSDVNEQAKDEDSDNQEVLRDQTLTLEALRRITPPLLSDTSEVILARLKNGEYASALELKMLAAGVSQEQIDLAQGLRAEADISRIEILASRADGEAALADLQSRVLRMAEATAKKTALIAQENTTVASMPGELIVADLLSRPHDLAYLDATNIFKSNSDQIFGYLCHLSDRCLFWWRAS